MWTLLFPSSRFNEQAASLLMQLYALSQCSVTIEGVLLESFTVMVIPLVVGGEQDKGEEMSINAGKVHVHVLSSAICNWEK